MKGKIKRTLRSGTSMFIAASFTIDKRWKQIKSPVADE